MGKLIDWHTHCFLPEHRSAEDAELQTRRNVLGTGQADPALHQAAIAAAGIDQFVVIAIPKREGIHTPHEFIAEYVAKFPGRAVGIGSVHPEEPGAAAELERAITKLGLR